MNKYIKTAMKINDIFLLQIHMIIGITQTTVGEKIENITSAGDVNVKYFITYYLRTTP